MNRRRTTPRPTGVDISSTSPIVAGDDKLLTIPEVAALLRVDPTEAYRMATRGDIPSFKIGRRRRVSALALAAWLASQEWAA